MKLKLPAALAAGLALFPLTALLPLSAGENVYIDDVPDYEWDYGCFGTATGNLFGFWDRNGFPDFYTGPTAGGVAPLDSRRSAGHQGIQSLWASAAGVDGRPSNRPGHVDDYYVEYESVAPDPYVTARRTEHAADCIGDYIGLNQNKWTNLNGECRGNIDGYSFVFWESTGARRNARLGLEPGIPKRSEIPSGLVEWSRSKGYDAESFCQLPDFGPTVTAGRGFTFNDMKAEIDAGYPVLLFLQPAGENSRTLHGQARVNPDIHGMLAFGYIVEDDGTEYVRFRTSWASGDFVFAAWSGAPWTPLGILNFPLRGVIGYHPKPKIRSMTRDGGNLVLRWDAPSATIVDAVSGERRPAQQYIVERAEALNASVWTPVSGMLKTREFRLPAPTTDRNFYRVRLVSTAGQG